MIAVKLLIVNIVSKWVIVV